MFRTWSKMGDEIVFHSEIILGSFSEKERKKEFVATMSLLKRGSFSDWKIAKKLNVPRGRIHGWIFGNRRPRVLKALEVAKKNKWLPMITSNKNFLTTLDVFAWMFGDGHIHNDGWNIFLFGQRVDLEKIEKGVKKLGLECEITEDPGSQSDENEYTETCRLTIKGNKKWVFTKILIGLGAPTGNKVKKNFLLPDWGFKLKPQLRKRFLETFLSNEITVRSLERGKWIPNINVRMRKIKENAENLTDFLDQIGLLMKEFGVEVSKPKVESEVEDKEGVKCNVVLHISKSITNIFTFSKNFKLIFAKEKQKRLDILKNATERKIRGHISNIENFEKALKLRRNGFGCRRVSRMLGLKLEKVSGWFHRGTKPLFLNRKDELQKLINI